MFLQTCQSFHFFPCLLIPRPCHLFPLFHPLLDRFKVLHNQFDIDYFGISCRIYTSHGMRDCLFEETPHDMNYEVDFTYVIEKPVTKTLSFASTFHKACYVHHFYEWMHNLFRFFHSSKFHNSFIFHHQETCIWIDCAERITLHRHTLSR